MLAQYPDVVFEYCREASQAVAAAEAFRPSVMLQDLVMPGINGLDLVKVFRSTPTIQDVPIIVLSGAGRRS